jgi:copper transport protein
MPRLLALLTLIALLLGSSPAWAHAFLLSSSPGAESSLDRSPGSIELTFNEPIQLLALKLLGTYSEDLSPATVPTVTEGRVVWMLPQPLPTGRYLVSWRAGSLDGHVVAGSFSFAIGEAASPPPADSGLAIEIWRWPDFTAHVLARILVLLAAGGALFRLLLQPPEALIPALRGRERHLACLGFLVTGLLIGIDGAMRAGLPLSGLLERSAWKAAFAAPGMQLNEISLLALLTLAAVRDRPRPFLALQGLAALLALAGFGSSGHALAVLPPVQGQALMILHGLAAALWIGAFDPLRRAFARETGPVTAALFHRFQRLGLVAVGAVAASGATLAWLLLPRWSDLWESPYGWRLSAKLLAVLAMLVIAGLNRLWLTSAALKNPDRLKHRLLWVLRLDLLVALIAVLLAVGLSLGPPPARSLVLDLSDANYRITLTLTPGRAGDNDAEIRIADRDGKPVDPQQVELRVEAPAAGIEPSAHEARPLAPGLYRVERLPLWAATGWKLRLHLMIDDFTMVMRDSEVTLAR